MENVRKGGDTSDTVEELDKKTPSHWEREVTAAKRTQVESASILGTRVDIEDRRGCSGGRAA